MSLYFKRLTKLRQEINNILSKKKKKPNKEQRIMIDFINGKTKQAVFKFDNITITLFTGDEKKGFKHILLRHYCNRCKGEISATDIMNFIVIYKKGMRLANKGVSNSNLTVYYYKKGLNSYKLVLKKVNEDSFVVTFYSAT
jgi:hypothetical protein